MTWHPLDLMRVIFVVLVTTMVIAAVTTRARPRNGREWVLVWVVLVFGGWPSTCDTQVR